MDFNQLNCFISVAQTLNFSEAARRNYVSQSTVSRYIGELEKEFGVQLFTRSHRDVIITNEGKILLPYAIDIVNTLSKAKTVIKQMRDGSTGKLTIGCDVTSMSFPSKLSAQKRIIKVKRQSSVFRSYLTRACFCSRNHPRLYCLWRLWICSGRSISRSIRRARSTTFRRFIWLFRRGWA